MLQTWRNAGIDSVHAGRCSKQVADAVNDCCDREAGMITTSHLLPSKLRRPVNST